jgi:hypothetical protein
MHPGFRRRCVRDLGFLRDPLRLRLLGFRHLRHLLGFRRPRHPLGFRRLRRQPDCSHRLRRGY